MVKKTAIKNILIMMIIAVLVVGGFVATKRHEALVKLLEKDKINNMSQKFANKWGKRIDRNDVIRIFNNNFKKFDNIASYISNYARQPDENFVVEKVKGRLDVKLISTMGLKQVTITEESVKQNIEDIFDRCNYKSIDDDGGNGIYFTLNDVNVGFGHGVVFTSDGKKPDGWGVVLTKIEKLTDNWYYFEAK